MQAIVSTFHIDWPSIVAQMINFALVVGVLWYFAFKPLAAALQSRASKIEQSLKDADAIAKNLAETKVQSEKIVTEARQQADSIIKEARKTADAQQQIAVDKVRAKSAAIVEASRGQIDQLKNQAVKQASAELAELVTNATAAVIGEKLTSATDAKLIERVLEKAKRL